MGTVDTTKTMTAGKHQRGTLIARATRIGMVVVILAVIAPGAFAIGTYSVDGDISDWGVSLETARYWSTVYFISSSFTPSTVGTIDYEVEDRYPSYTESYDYEALYFDDTNDSVHVGVISSHAWNPADNVILVTINGVTLYADDADEFAWADLNKDEEYRYTDYPNYFIEASWSKSDFGEVEPGDTVFAYANCHPTCDDVDRISLCGTIDNPPGNTPSGNPIPEPATFALIGAGLVGLLGRASRRGKRRKLFEA